MALMAWFQRRLDGVRPIHVMGACLAWLALCWLIFLGVDTYDWLGIRRTGPVEEGGHGLIWMTLFANGGPTEWIQWAVLGVAGILAAWLAGGMRDRESGDAAAGDDSVKWFWLLMSVAFTMMLLEDAGEMRQRVWGLTVAAFGESRSRDFVMEFAQFAILASVPLAALWFFGREVLRQRDVGVYLLLGFLCYAIAGGSSATRDWGGEGPVGGWYAMAGETIHGWIGGVMSHPTYPQELVYYLLMDRVYEESIELLGASFFLVAALMATRALRAQVAAPEEAMDRVA